MIAGFISILIGVSLGLLGAGGSILTVPFLLYVVEVEPKAAIAASLLVVGVTSAAGMLTHARGGRVQWGTGLRFGGAAMAGAFAGGRVSHLLPAPLLLAGFALMMLATAVAMMRGRRLPDEPRPGAMPSPLLCTLLGAGTGFVAGLLGAGGGFLVVPALVLFGRVPMRSAIGTSLLVLTLQSLAGFAGHLGGVDVPWGMTALVAAASVAGSLVGGRLSGKLSQATLRQGFAWFAVVMAVFILARQLPDTVRLSAVYQSVFVQRWPFWVAGPALAAVALALLWVDNKLLGASTGCAELCRLRSEPALRGSWRVKLLVGLVLGGVVAGALAGTPFTLAAGGFDRLVSSSLWIKLPVLVGAGMLIGYGARMAGGCTSGHSLVGSALGSKASWLATLLFMAAGFTTTWVLTLLRG